MIIGVLLILAVHHVESDKYFEFEDIPIEHYDHADAQTDSIDVELMPRSSRSLFSNFNSQKTPIPHDDPHLSDFEKFFENVPVINLRKKRNAKFDVDAVKELGKPLELHVIEPESYTEGEPVERKNASERQNKRSLAINDFIRFRRSSEQDDMNKDTEMEEKKPDNESRYFLSFFIWVLS